jgi:hypothetical protein
MASYRSYVEQLCGFFEGCEFHHIPRANNDEADQLSKIGSTRQAIPARVLLEIICKPSIKPSPEFGPIHMPEDPAPAKAPLSNSGAAASEQEGGVSQSSTTSSTKDPGAADSRPASTASQLVEAGTSIDPGAADPLVASVFHIREIPSWAEPFSNYLLTGDLPLNEIEARRLQRCTQAYTIINNELYMCNVT